MLPPEPLRPPRGQTACGSALRAPGGSLLPGLWIAAGGNMANLCDRVCVTWGEAQRILNPAQERALPVSTSWDSNLLPASLSATPASSASSLNSSLPRFPLSCPPFPPIPPPLSWVPTPSIICYEVVCPGCVMPLSLCPSWVPFWTLPSFSMWPTPSYPSALSSASPLLGSLLDIPSPHHVPHPKGFLTPASLSPLMCHCYPRRGHSVLVEQMNMSVNE